MPAQVMPYPNTNINVIRVNLGNPPQVFYIAEPNNVPPHAVRIQPNNFNFFIDSTNAGQQAADSNACVGQIANWIPNIGFVGNPNQVGYQIKTLLTTGQLYLIQ